MDSGTFNSWDFTFATFYCLHFFLYTPFCFLISHCMSTSKFKYPLCQTLQSRRESCKQIRICGLFERVNMLSINSKLTITTQCLKVYGYYILLASPDILPPMPIACESPKRFLCQWVSESWFEKPCPHTTMPLHFLPLFIWAINPPFPEGSEQAKTNIPRKLVIGPLQ